MPAGSAVFGLRFILEDAASAGLRGISGAIKEVAGRATTMQSKAMMAQQAMMTTGKAFVGAGVAIGGVLAYGVKQAATFEGSMAQMAILTGKTTDQLGDLKEAIFKAAAPLPISAQELADASIIAAKFGIEGEEAMIKIGKAAVMMAQQTDFSVEGAAQSFATLSNVFGVNMKDANRLASVLSRLDMVSVGTATEISDITLRAQVGARQFGFNVQQTAAFAAVMRNAGISSERAGTNMNLVFMALLKNKKAMAAMTGVTEQQITTMQNLPAGAEKAQMAQELFLKFMGSAAQQTNEQWTQTMQAFGISGTFAQAVASGFRDEMKKTTATGTKLTDVLNMGNQLWEEGTAVQSGFEKQMGTLGSRWATFSGTIKTFAIQLGDKLLPLFKRLLDIGAKVGEWLVNLSPTTKKIIAYMMLFASVLLIVVGGLLILGALAIGAAISIGAMAVAFGVAGGAGAFFTAVLTALWAALWPVVLVIGLLVAGFFALRAIWRAGLGDFIIAQFNAIKEALSPVIELVRTIYGALSSLVGAAGGMGTGIIGTSAKIAAAIFQYILTPFFKAAIAIAKVIGFVAKIASTIIKVGIVIARVANYLLGGLFMGAIKGVAAAFKWMGGIASAVADRIKGAFASLGGRLKSLAVSIGGWFKSTAVYIGGVYKNMFSKIAGWGSSAFSTLKERVTPFLEAIKAKALSVWESIKEPVMSVVGPIIAAFQYLYNQVATLLGNLKTLISDTFSDIPVLSWLLEKGGDIKGIWNDVFKSEKKSNKELKRTGPIAREAADGMYMEADAAKQQAAAMQQTIKPLTQMVVETQRWQDALTAVEKKNERDPFKRLNTFLEALMKPAKKIEKTPKNAQEAIKNLADIGKAALANQMAPLATAGGVALKQMDLAGGMFVSMFTGRGGRAPAAAATASPGQAGPVASERGGGGPTQVTSNINLQNTMQLTSKLYLDGNQIWSAVQTKVQNMVERAISNQGS